MTIATVLGTRTSNSRYGLPPTLRTAQAAIQWPKVQDMLRRLSAYRLGIFMPHQHDEVTGELADTAGPEDEEEQPVKHKMPEDD